MTGRSKDGVTFIEVVVSICILAVSLIPLYTLMSGGVRSVGRTEDHVYAYSLAEKIIESLKARLTNQATMLDAIKLETNEPMPVLEYFQAEEDGNADGTLDALGAVLTSKGTPEAKHALAALERFQCTIKNKELFPKLSEIKGDRPYERLSGVTKVVTVVWKDRTDNIRSVKLEHFQSLYGNYQFVINSNYADAPVFFGPGSVALNRSYQANLRLAEAMTEDAQLSKMWFPPEHMVFESFMFWPGDPMRTPLLKGKTRINVKVHLLAKVTGLTHEEVIDGDPHKQQTRTELEERTLREGLTEEEKGRGFISSRFIRAIDEMNLKCLSCHSQYFFRTDPQLKANWKMYVGEDCIKDYEEKLKPYANTGDSNSGEDANKFKKELERIKWQPGTIDFSGSRTHREAEAAAEIFNGKEDYVNME